jgi:hypothetical protein
MKVVSEGYFLELTPYEGEPALKRSQGSSVPKVYATQQSCTKELNYNMSRGIAKAGRVFKGYIVLEDEGGPVMTPIKRKPTTLDELIDDQEELPF